MADIDAAKCLTGLLNGIAQKAYHNHDEVTKDLLRTELYPDLSPEDFHVLHDKMGALLKVGGSGSPCQSEDGGMVLLVLVHWRIGRRYAAVCNMCQYIEITSCIQVHASVLTLCGLWRQLFLVF